MMKKLIIVSLFALLATVYNADTNATDISSLNPIESLKFKPDSFKEPIEFNVTLPDNYEKDLDKTYFVLIDFHPRSQPFLSGMQDWLSHNGEWPWLKTIIVTQARYNKELAALYKSLETDKLGSPLLDFIEKDLIGAIETKYRSNGFNIFSGFRGNGSVALSALLYRPDLFNGLIVSSPQIGNDFVKISSNAKTHLAKLDDKPRFLFMSLGSHGYEKADRPAFEAFEKALKSHAPESLDWHVRRFDDAYFMSQPILAALNGIELLFSDIHNNLKADSTISKQGAAAIIAYYDRLSNDKYGFEVSARQSLSNLAFSLLETKPTEAVKVFKKSIEKYPESAFAYHDLAEAYSRLAQFDNAVNYQKIAVEKTANLIKWHQNKQKQYLQEYQDKLKSVKE